MVGIRVSPVRYWVVIYLFSFFFNLADKNLLIVEKFSSVAKLASTVYETESAAASYRCNTQMKMTDNATKSEHFMVTKTDESLKV